VLPSSGEGRVTPLLDPLERADQVQRLRLALARGPNRVGVSLPSPEDGNRCIFRNVVVRSYLEFRTIDNVQKPSNSECCTPSSGPCGFYISISVSCFISDAIFRDNKNSFKEMLGHAPA
jgi:hypothetical protein